MQSGLLLTTTTASPVGKYRVNVNFGWNTNSSSDDFESQILVNGVQNGEIFKKEPKDISGNHNGTESEQREHFSRTFYYDVTTAAVQTIELLFRTDLAPNKVSIWDAVIEFWRVS